MRSVQTQCQVGFLFIHRKAIKASSKLESIYDLETEQQIPEQNPQISPPVLLYLISFLKPASVFLLMNLGLSPSRSSGIVPNYS